MQHHAYEAKARVVVLNRGVISAPEDNASSLIVLMDLTSNDLNLKVQEILFEAYGERFGPLPGLRQKVYANHLGRKTGRGWFDYQK